MSNHLKSITVPNSWVIEKKHRKYVTKPHPGPNSLELSIPLVLVLKSLGVARTTKEAKKLLQTNNISVDGKRVKDKAFPFGFMNILSLGTKDNYRLQFSNKGKFIVEKTSKANLKPCKITGKRAIKKGAIQLNLFDGRNITVEGKEHKVGDTLIIEVPSQKISSHLKLGEGSFVTFIGGKHKGTMGTVSEMDKKNIVIKNTAGEAIKTLTRYAFAITEDFVK